MERDSEPPLSGRPPRSCHGRAGKKNGSPEGAAPFVRLLRRLGLPSEQAGLLRSLDQRLEGAAQSARYLESALTGSGWSGARPGTPISACPVPLP